MSSNDKIFSNWLSRQLQRKGMSGGELSEKSGISRSAVYYYIEGTRVPEKEVAVKIAKALGLNADAIPAYEPRKVGRPKKNKTLKDLRKSIPTRLPSAQD